MNGVLYSGKMEDNADHGRCREVDDRMLICLLNHEEQDDGQQDMFPLEKIREHAGLREQILAEKRDLHDAKAGGCDQAGGSSRCV